LGWEIYQIIGIEIYWTGKYIFKEGLYLLYDYGSLMGSSPLFLFPASKIHGSDCINSAILSLSTFITILMLQLHPIRGTQRTTPMVISRRIFASLRVSHSGGNSPLFIFIRNREDTLNKFFGKVRWRKGGQSSYSINKSLDTMTSIT
jgi:hypothetical protein